MGASQVRAMGETRLFRAVQPGVGSLHCISDMMGSQVMHSFNLMLHPGIGLCFGSML